MATATITQEELQLTNEVRDQIALEEQRRIAEESRANLAPINPHTGHRMTDNDIAIHHAIGPDVADPPSGGGGPPGDLPGNGGGGPPSRRPGFEGFPGGFPGGPPGGGHPGGGLPGAGLIVPPPSNKLAGEAPTVFDRERAKVEAFLTQWHVYWGMNADEGIMAMPYRCALLFLSYIKGVNGKDREGNDNNDNGRGHQGAPGNQEICETQTQWIPLQIEFEDDSRELKKYSLLALHIDQGEGFSKEEGDIITKGQSCVIIAERMDTWLTIADNHKGDINPKHPLEPEVATRAVQDVPPQQRASDWLNGVAGESDDVKDIILQQLWRKEGFQDA
ncbi:hypothetical protein H4582DRAFT_2078544 [Lactarius indigo]|nr:hypothetical protein H4582DRAFT_2078544 [Lactarius indigo]